MGVPKFFRYISERYPCLSELITEYQIPEFDNLYLDMNGIIHMCSHPDDYDPHFRITEEKIFSDIFHYIEVLFRMIKPQELFFMAVDGVAPRAKMNQQRGRRFRSAKEAEQLEAKAKERGEELPAEARFDSNCITPGTVFMARLHEQLKYFVTTKISTDRLWQKCKIVLSGHETPGEGEHKIMDYIRYMKAQPDYNPNTRHCLYGLDADLIMLGLCSHEPHFSLLREEVRFGKKAKRKSIPEQINFYLLHLSLMREYLELEFMPLKKSLPFEYDMEKIIDDWVLMGFLVGNDFIPHLPNLHIANGALPVLYNAYMKILPTLEGYINEAGILNLERFEKFMSALAAIDLDNFSEQYADLKYFCSKTGRKPNTKERTSYKRKDLEVWQPDESELSVLDEAPKTTNKDLEALIKSTDDMFADEPFLKTEPDTSTVEINLVSNPDLIVMAKESDFPSIALLPNISDEQKLNTSLELLNISNNIIDKSSLLSSSESTEDTEISPISFKSVLLEESFDKSNNLEDKSADEDCNSVQDTAQSLEQMNLNQTDNSKTEATEKVASVPKYEALLSFLQNRVAEESIDETAVIKPTKKILEPSESNLADLALDIDLHDDEEYEDILSPYYSDSDDDEDDKLMNEEFILHKNDYYMNKLDYSKITPEVMRDQAEGYVRAIQWNLHYYYNGVCSWSWYYPHHYAPYISDIKDFSNLILEYDLGVPFKPFEQLLAVLPAASKVLLPEPYRELMMSEESSIIEYYPQEFRTDLNGKRQEWEAVVLIPFIAEDMLLKAMGPCNEKLTPEEIKRNTHGPMLVYEYTADDLGKYETPEYYPTINSNHAKLTPVTIEEIRVPIDKLVKGPCPGSIHDVYYPGFPTFRHLKYTGQLEKAKVRVFDAPSQNENMIVCIQNTEKDVNIEELAKNLLGKPVYVSWPHLIEALVVTVSDSTCRYHKTTEEGKFSIEFNKGNLLSFWRAQRESVTEGYKERRGIDVGDSTILIHVKRLVGKKYAYTQAGRVSFEKQWADNESCYPFQAVVKDLAVYEQLLPKYENIQELFPVKSKCFMIGHPYYGSLAEVIDNTTLKSGRVKVTVAVCQEPDLSEVISLANEERYMIGGHAASRLSISSHLLSRLTGAVFVVPGHRTSVPPKNSHKLNVGLNLKLNKKNEEIPGYTKKVDNQWFYSQKSVDLVREYMEFCPELVSYMSKHMGNDVFYEAELFSDEMGEGKIQKIIDWIKKQPFSLIDRQKVGSKTVDTEIVLKIEELVDKWNASQTKKDLVMQVKPHLLYKPEIQTGRLPPDITTVFELYDRVINVREGYTVPFGCKGTVIGIQATVQTGNNGDEIMEAMYDVVFDQAFAGGIQLNCSPNRGYRLPNTALINISHGMRQVQQKTLNPADVPATNNPWYGKPVVNYQPPVQSQNSAFASWNPPMSSNSPNFPGLTHKLPQLRGNSFQQFQQQYGHQQAAKSYQQPQPYHQPPAQSYQQPPKPFQQSPQTYQQQPPNQYQQASYQQQMPIPFPHPLNQRMPIQVHSMNQNHRKPPRLQQQRQQMQKQSPQQKQPQAVQQPMEQSPQKQEGNKTPKLGAEFKAFLQDLQKNQSKANPVPNTGPNIVQTHMKHPVGLGAIQSQQTAQFSQMFNQPSAPPAPVKSGQQGPSDDETEALKKLLNISVTNPTPSPNKQIVSSLDTKQTQQISVQDFFAHARNNDPKLNQSAPSMPVMQPTILQQPPSSPYFSVQLLNYCQAQRIGIPRYSYFTTNKNKIRAQISLQDGRSVYGDECSSKEEATESAAKILLTEGNQIGGSHKKQSNKAQAQPFMPHPNVGPKGFPVPPKQWCQNEKTGQKSFHSSNSSKGGENVKQTTSVKQESEPIVSANLIKQTPNPDENKPGPTPFVPLQADIKKTRTKTLSSSSDGSQSKQCNIKHGTNSSNSTNSHNIKNKPTPEHTTTPQVQPTPITQPKRRVRKSRIAANFSAAPKE